jgi:hypothetical protein
MATLRVEWVKLSVGPLNDGGGANIISGLVGSGAKFAVTAVATTAGSRPTAPAGAHYGRVTVTSGNAIVAWGADPTASQTNGLLVAAGNSELIPVAAGEKLSFVDLV